MKPSIVLLTLFIAAMMPRSADAFVVKTQTKSHQSMIGFTATKRSSQAIRRRSKSALHLSSPVLEEVVGERRSSDDGVKNSGILTAGSALLLSALVASNNNLLDSRFLDYTSDMIHGSVGISVLPIITSLVAATIGVTAVSAVANIVDQTTPIPPYNPNAQRFDQTHFAGRFCHMLLACDPRLLLYSKDEVQYLHSLLQTHNGVTSKEQDYILWEAKRVSESALHPETGAWIPRPFRMSGYLPYNGPICIAMLLSQSTLALLFWSWINQSQNALVNYYNRNTAASEDDDDMSTLYNSYVVAVGSALTVAFGLVTLVQQNFDAETSKMMLQWIPFPSAVVASSLNCFIVREVLKWSLEFHYSTIKATPSGLLVDSCIHNKQPK